MVRTFIIGLAGIAILIAAASPAWAQTPSLTMEQFIAKACGANERCRGAGAQSAAEGRSVIMAMAQMCQQIPRSKEEGECFQAGYGSARQLTDEALKPTLERHTTSRELFAKYMDGVHTDCGVRSQCYWIRLMGFDREFEIFRQTESR